MARQIPWVRVIAEGAAIVASILLAFGIQAWWERRGDDLAEVEYLEAIRDEIDRNLSALDGNEAIAELVDGALARAETLLAADLHTDSAAVFVSSLLVGAEPAGPPRVATAVFDDLTSTGRIVLIRDLDVRRAVLELYAQIDVSLGRMQRRTEAVDGRLYATVARHIPPGLVRRDDSPISLTFDSTAVPSPELGALAERIGADPIVRDELRAAFLEHEDERVYRERHRLRLLDAKALLETHIE